MSIWQAIIFLGALWLILPALGRAMGEAVAVIERGRAKRPDRQAPRHRELQRRLELRRAQRRQQRPRTTGSREAAGEADRIGDDELRAIVGEDLLRRMQESAQQRGQTDGRTEH